MKRIKTYLSSPVWNISGLHENYKSRVKDYTTSFLYLFSTSLIPRLVCIARSSGAFSPQLDPIKIGLTNQFPQQTS